jgi:hypothetical protein
MDFLDVCWHDGNIKSIDYKFPLNKKQKAKIEIIANVATDFDYSDRHDIKITFANTLDVTKSIDYEILANNVKAGAISSAHQHKTAIATKKYMKYEFYLFGGLISIIAKSSKITKLRSSK